VAKLTRKQQVFINLYIQYWNATRAAQEAGYKHPAEQGYKLLKLPAIKEAISTRLKQSQIEGDEVLVRISQQATLNKADFYIFDWVQKIDSQNQPIPVLDTQGNPLIVDGHQVYEQSYEAVGVNWNTFEKYGHLVKGLRYDRKGRPIIEFHDAQAALLAMARFVGVDMANRSAESGEFVLPADCLASTFLNVYRDIKKHKHTEYILKGGRGSTKSTFASLVILCLLKNNPSMHVLAVRQVANTLKDSVYSQFIWSINELGLRNEFRYTVSPLEITYLPTDQKIYFRGADDPGKIKSIKPTFGAIGIVWFEETSEFYGEEAIRNITQSVIRGTDLAYIFKTYNPPRTSGNWINKYILIPKETQYQHDSTYLDVPREWLGQVFIDEAEHLRETNPAAYEHEYLGEVNGLGDNVFTNLTIRKITDDEIATFDNILWGLDFGYFPHPAHMAKVHYDAKNHILYVIGEVRKWKTSNEDLYKAIVEYGYNNNDLIICDSAEPKSVADFRAYGATARGAEKGSSSVKYSVKWLQSLKEIVLDPKRVPYTVEEMTDYSYERTKDGEILEAYPREKDDAIASIRYATNLHWRRRGE